MARGVRISRCGLLMQAKRFASEMCRRVTFRPPETARYGLTRIDKTAARSTAVSTPATTPTAARRRENTSAQRGNQCHNGSQLNQSYHINLRMKKPG